MFTIFKAETLTSKTTIHILDFGYLTNSHPKFRSEEKAEAYIRQAEKDQAKVSRAKAIKKEADDFRAAQGMN